YYDSFLREAMQVANSSALFLQHNLRMSRAQIYQIVHENVSLHPIVFGSAVAFDFDPDEIQKSGLFFAPYAYRSIRDGKESIVTIDIAKTTDYTDADWEWWDNAELEKTGFWTAPYFSEDESKQLMATYAVPILDDNEFVGVTTVDIALNPLKQIVSKALSLDMDFLIINRNGEYLSGQNSTDILSRSIFDETKNKSIIGLKSLVDRMMDGEYGMEIVTGWETGKHEKQWVFYRTIPMTGWHLVIKVDEQKIIQKARDDVLHIATLMLATLIIIIIVIWLVVGRMTSPLERLTKSVKKFSTGKMETIADTNRKDEIGLLARNFAQMAKDLVKREADLRQARSQGFSRIVQQLTGQYFYFTHDKSGEMTYVSNEVETILGYSVDDFKTNYNRYLTLNPINLEAKRRTQKLLQGLQHEFSEIEMIDAKGDLHQIELIEVPVQNEHQEIIGVEGMAHDVTSRKIEEEKFKVLFESSSEANILFNDSGILDCNQAFLNLFNYKTKEDIVGYYPYQLCPETQTDGRNSGEVIRSALLLTFEESTQRVHLELQKADGSLFSSEISITSFTVSDHLFYIAIIYDLTERIQTEQEILAAKNEAERANNAKSTFLSNMSHELRTPLNGVLGYTQVLQDSTELTQIQGQNLNAIESCSHHLLSLINDVLDISKIESGFVKITQSHFELSNFLQEVYHIVKPKSQHKGLDLIIEKSESCPTYIYTDKTKLKQILINLINNAIKFTEQGHVCLIVLPEISDDHSASLKFEVKDSGIGIDQHDQEMIFEAFKQTEQGIGEGGTGLGLAISQHLAKVLQYTPIKLVSHFGEGSNFSFKIPLTDIEDSELYNLEIMQSEQVHIDTLTSIEEDKPVTSDILNQIGLDLLSQISKSSRLGDIQTLNQSITEVFEYSETLANMLKNWANNFEFKKIESHILELINQLKD
ncbi:MAG: PAS domain S-box protein, partial [Gammaproteobacteria bacterium]|nr:PAS domain S-box protein [Gammaproteobacteria bacterium]